MTPEALFLQQLPLVEKVLQSVCRRHAFPRDEAEEFASWAKVRLIEDDYAVLRRFRGESLLSTYLVTVLHNLFRDYRTHRWGKWRPSAAARQLGEEAVQLETLLERDGHDLASASRMLRERFGSAKGEREIASLAARLPHRPKRRFEGAERLKEEPAASQADERVREREQAELARRTEGAINEALAQLAPRDRLLLKLRFADGLAVATIAELLAEPAKPLYGRLDRALATLRRELTGAGVALADAASLIGWSGLELRLDFGPGAVPRAKPGSRPDSGALAEGGFEVEAESSALSPSHRKEKTA